MRTIDAVVLRLALLALLACACGRVGFERTIRSDDGGGEDVADASCSGPLSSAAASSFSDSFGDGTVAPAWEANACISETGGELVATPPANMPSAYCVAGTLTLYHLVCDAITIRVAETTTPTVGAQTAIYLTRTDNRSIQLILEMGGFLFTHDNEPGSVITLPGTYDPVRDAWWRIRGVPGTIYLDTSDDGAAWVERGSYPVDFALDRMKVSLAAGTHMSLAAPGVARFRCLNLPPPCS